MYIHPAGYRVILVFFLVVFLIALLVHQIPGIPRLAEYVVGGALLILCLLVLWFFRIPPRPFNAAPNEVTSVSDGKVVLVEEVDEPEVIGGKAIKICVFLSIFDVHAQWAPIGGKLEYFKYHEGEYLVAWHEKSSTLNERTTFGAGDPIGDAGVAPDCRCGGAPHPLVCGGRAGDRPTVKNVASSCLAHGSIYTCRWMPRWS